MQIWTNTWNSNHKQLSLHISMFVPLDCCWLAIPVVILHVTTSMPRAGFGDSPVNRIYRTVLQSVDLCLNFFVMALVTVLVTRLLLCWRQVQVVKASWWHVPWGQWQRSILTSSFFFSSLLVSLSFSLVSNWNFYGNEFILPQFRWSISLLGL